MLKKTNALYHEIDGGLEFTITCQNLRQFGYKWFWFSP